MDEDCDNPVTVQARFKSDSGESIGNPFDLPVNITRDQLQLICNALLEQVSAVQSHILSNTSYM